MREKAEGPGDCSGEDASDEAFPAVSVVIPSYNRRENVVALLADLHQQEGVSFEVIVVDDFSKDGSADEVAQRFPQVTLIRSDRNGGPCVARNKGILAARGEFIVGLDSDVTAPDRRLLEKVVRSFHEMPHVTGFAFRLLKPDGVADDEERWWHPVPIARFATCAFETSYFSGTAYAFRREPLIQAGLYPEILYMHYEEVVLAYRILDRGGIIAHAPHLVALHHAAPTDRRSKIRTFYKPRSQVLVALLCYPLARGAVWLLPRLAFGFTVALRNRHLSEFVNAIRSACALMPECLRSRKALSAVTWKRIASLRSGVSCAPTKAAVDLADCTASA